MGGTFSHSEADSMCCAQKTTEHSTIQEAIIINLICKVYFPMWAGSWWSESKRMANMGNNFVGVTEKEVAENLHKSYNALLIISISSFGIY